MSAAEPAEPPRFQALRGLLRSPSPPARVAPRPSEPTEKQLAVLSFIRRYMRSHGFPPSVREIGDEFRIRSPNGVMFHLKAMRRKGMIRRASAMASRQWVPIVPDGCCPCCGNPAEGTDP